MNRLVVSLIVVFYPFAACSPDKTQDDEWYLLHAVDGTPVNLTKRCVTAGSRLQAIGLQNGDYTDVGGHVPHEMSGLWSHPFKLVDGFWFDVEKEPIKANRFTSLPYGSVFSYDLDKVGVQIIREQFVPEDQRALCIKMTFVNSADAPRKLNVDFRVKIDLRPVWISERVGIHNAPDSVWYDSEEDMVLARDLKNDWFVALASDKKIESVDISDKQISHDTTHMATLHFNIDIPAKGKTEQMFFIDGENVNALHQLQKDHKALLESKKAKYKTLLQTSAIDIPDKKLEFVYDWIKFNTQWLVVDVPGIGRGLGAGLPEYPWWFGCDNTYALQGVLATGDFELAKSTLRLLKDVSEKTNGNGRVVHEISTSGAVYNPGNTQETAHFVMAVWKTFQWTGDREFLKEFYPFVKKSMQWLTVEMDKNKDLFPEGYGIMEVKGLSAELIDVAVYTQQALTCASLMAEVFSEDQIAKEYKARSSSLKDKINSEFWDDKEKHYMDFYATAREAMTVADGAIEQYRNIDGQGKDDVVSFYKDLKVKFGKFPPDYSHGWSTNLNWVMNTPMEMGIAPDDRALAALDKMSRDYVGQWGPYLSAVHKTHSMTISTGVQAVAECRYGRVDRALMYMNDIVNTFGYEMPGSINEMMPDYGCFVQAWTNYGIMVPTIEYIFGVKPSAHLRKIILEPQLPTGWNDLKLTNQKVGDNTFDWAIEKKDNSIRYKLTWEKDGWDTEIRLPYVSGMKFQFDKKEIVPDAIVNGKAVFPYNNHKEILLTVVNALHE